MPVSSGSVSADKELCKMSRCGLFLANLSGLVDRTPTFVSISCPTVSSPATSVKKRASSSSSSSSSLSSTKSTSSSSTASSSSSSDVGFWLLAAPGMSCHAGCEANEAICDEAVLWRQSQEVDSEEKLADVVAGLGGRCSWFQVGSGRSPDVPAVATDSQVCFPSAWGRSLASHSCSSTTHSKKQRLCFCSEDADKKSVGPGGGALAEVVSHLEWH
mmetsp:Transcript_23006/g.48940  ORF Transcript_23006/g.48940 Transcript_23006/m.48940 type:complete len:216 (-) Transcript_23006:300-947(-)